MFNKIKNKKAIIIIIASALVLLATAPWMNNKSIQNDILQKYGRQDGSIDKNGNLFCDYEARWLPFGRLVVSCEGGYFVPFFYFKKGNNDNAQKQQIHENNKMETENANWKTYRNEEYGFELRHPKNLKTSHSDIKGRSVVVDGDNLILNINPVNFIKEWDVKSICYMADIGNTRILEKLEVNGSKMPLCIDDSQKEILIFYRILIPKNKNQTISTIGDYFEFEAQIYGGSTIQDRLNMFKQMLSTFKFTD